MGIILFIGEMIALVASGYGNVVAYIIGFFVALVLILLGIKRDEQKAIDSAQEKKSAEKCFTYDVANKYIILI